MERQRSIGGKVAKDPHVVVRYNLIKKTSQKDMAILNHTEGMMGWTNRDLGRKQET